MSTRGITAGVLLFVAGVLCGVAALWYFLGGLERWHAAQHEPLTTVSTASAPVPQALPEIARPTDASSAASTMEPIPSSVPVPRSPPPLPASEPGYDPAPDLLTKRVTSANSPLPLRSLDLIVPVEGITAAQLEDHFTDARSEGRRHEAVDIMAPRGTPVLAAESGRIVKLFESEKGGLTVYQFDKQDELCYYYAHLDRYADGLAEGQAVAQGEVIGYVGHTGNADPSAPHLHFAIFQLGPERHWWQGVPINPYPHLVGEFVATREKLK